MFKAPWEVSSSIDADIDSLIQEKSPFVHARANSMGPWLAYELQLQQNARQQILSMESSLKLLLARIQKFKSHTFHVFLRDLIPGAKFRKLKCLISKQKRAADKGKGSSNPKRRSSYFGFTTIPVTT